MRHLNTSRLSDNSRGDKTDFDILDKVDFVSTALNLNVCSDLRRSKSGMNNHIRVSPKEKKEEYNNRNQIINLPKLRNQLLNAHVVLERLSNSTAAVKLRETDSVTSDNSDKLTTTCNRQKPANLIKRYCPRCKNLVADASVSKSQTCAKCETLLIYQCARCDKLYSNYKSMFTHLESRCNSQNLNLKCPKCDYRTHVKASMRRHLKYCTSKIIYSCSRCKLTTKHRRSLYRHMQKIHGVVDNDMKAHAESVAIGDTSDFADDEKKDVSIAEMLTTQYNKQNRTEVIRRCCSKCKVTVSDASVSTTQSCAKCGTPLDFQCARCDKLYSLYRSLIKHLNSVCDPQNLDLKCPKCDYQTHVKSSLSNHLKYCTSGIIYSCSHCKFTTEHRSSLYNHMKNIHKDMYQAACSKCSGKPNKCKRCENIMLICKNCHVGFSSNERLLKHYESCEQ